MLFVLSATAAPSISQKTALAADVVAQVAPWEVQHFTVSSSSARRRLEDTSGHDGNNSSAKSIHVAIRSRYSHSDINKRQLIDVVWTASFDVVAEIDSVSVAAASVTAALVDPAFSSAVATSTGATVDPTSISVVILTRKPTAAPSDTPTLSPESIVEDAMKGANSSRSSAAFDIVVALLCSAIGGLLFVIAYLLWRSRDLARGKSSDKGPLAVQSAPYDHTSQSPSSIRPLNLRTSNPFTNKSMPSSSVMIKSSGQDTVLGDVADDKSYHKDFKYEDALELSGAVGFIYSSGESFKSVVDCGDGTHGNNNPFNPSPSLTCVSGGSRSDKVGSADQADLENSRARRQERQWESHRAAHSSNVGQQSRAEQNRAIEDSTGSSSPVLGSPLGAKESWGSEKEYLAERTWEGTASPMHATQRKKASSPTTLAAPESCRQFQPPPPKKRTPYKDDSTAAAARADLAALHHRPPQRAPSKGNQHRTSSGSAARFSGTNANSRHFVSAKVARSSPDTTTLNMDTLSPPVPPIPMRQTPVVLHQSIMAPIPIPASDHPAKNNWIDESHKQKSIEKSTLNDKGDVTTAASPASKKATSLLATARQLKSQGNLIGASTLLQRALVLNEDSSNHCLNSLDTAQAQFLLAGCLRRLSARGEEHQLGTPGDQKNRLKTALELYELCTTSMAQELAFTNDEDENALHLAIDLASAYNDWGVGLWQRGHHGDAEAAVLCFSRALNMRRKCRGEVLRLKEALDA